MNPNLPVKDLPNVGPGYSQKLKRLGIETVEDLIYHFPFRYEDFSQVGEVNTFQEGQKITIQGTVLQIQNIRTRTGKFLTRAQVADPSRVIEVLWFNQPYLTKIIKSGNAISLSGKVQIEGFRPKLISPAYELIRQTQNPQTIHTAGLISIYPETEGLSSRWLRTKIRQILPQYIKSQDEFLPERVKRAEKLMDLEEALEKIHFPKSTQDIEKARQRLAFDELFLLQLQAQNRKREWQDRVSAPKIILPSKLLAKFLKKLPYELTSAQKKAYAEILSDMGKNIPTNRLLEGEVGSGKTVVAAICALATVSNGFDVLFAAPTEILVNQHYATLNSLLKDFNVKVGIWTAAKKQSGQVVCGTHALLLSFVPKGKIGLVIVDEQHRFGVAQRTKLFLDHSYESTPHLLTMTATPIPRTLALTVYGDLDLSVLDEMPKGRLKISTFVVPNIKRNAAYKFIEKEASVGKQAFIITPFVEPSESQTTVKAAKEEFEKLKTKFSKKIKLGLLHGRLKSREKEKVMDEFKKNKLQVLVATPVVEVGIDNPNASIILIESAERFGLAQLHQLRGRVGRGNQKSYCFLFTESENPITQKRLKSLEKVSIGFELAEIDLALRGPGEVFGLKQSGYVNLKIADITDRKTVSKTQKYAQEFLANDELKTNPKIANKLKKLQNLESQPN